MGPRICFKVPYEEVGQTNCKRNCPQWPMRNSRVSHLNQLKVESRIPSTERQAVLGHFWTILGEF